MVEYLKTVMPLEFLLEDFSRAVGREVVDEDDLLKDARHRSHLHPPDDIPNGSLFVEHRDDNGQKGHFVLLLGEWLGDCRFF